MVLEAGARLGQYKILGTLGAGGMGVVYRAHDSSLGRDVALKVLPPDVANDNERLARFAREARVLASLDHPNIGTIHGWEESTGVPAIVLELVEGPTLRDRIGAGPMALDEALGIARQIADALETAHDRGIVHRDLKPANIKIRPDGRVKVLDFGLAKALDGDRPSAGDSQTTAAATQSGTVVGTPAYMSPEQARGEQVTRRTDVWSFGIVLFEMLSGRHPFGSGPSTEVVAAILRATPEWEMLPAGTPSPVIRLLRRCLEKDPRSRIHDIGDARLELEDASSGRSSSPSGANAATAGRGAASAWSRGTRVGAIAGVVALVAAAIAAGYFLGARRAAAPSTSQAQPVRLQILAPADTRFQNAPAVSPDGRWIAFVAAREGGPRQLWIKALDAAASTVLSGTDGATFPFWNPESTSIAFFAESKMKRVSVRGDGPAIAICDAAQGRGGAWFDDDTIVFSPEGFAPLMRVHASGGTPVAITELNKDQGERSHRFPARVSAKYLLYYVSKDDRQSGGARLVSLDDPGHAINFYPAIDEVEYADGFLFSVKTGQLRAQAMHLPDGELTGDVTSIGAVITSETAARDVWSVGRGTVALMERVDPPSQLTWRGRDGRDLGPIGPEGDYHGVELSPNRQQVATTKLDGECLLLDTARGATMRALRGTFPTWSADGSRVAVMASTAQVAGTNRVISASATGTEPDVRLVSDTPYWPRPIGWTPDGSRFLWVQGNRADIDILTAPTGQLDRVEPFLQGAGRNVEGRLSPDGHWIAYASDPDPSGRGRFEIVIQRFPSGGARFPVSTTGGRYPRWRADGKELYYLSGSALMAVRVTLSDPPEIGTPQKLFDVRLVTERDPIVFATYEYDVGDAAGTRFLMNQVVHDPVQAMDVIVNWHRE